jgi:hypothetical protein
MFKIIGAKIFLTRGDTAFIDIKILRMDGTEYQLKAGDQVLFTVKKNARDETVLFQKTPVDGIIKISPADTDHLRFGDYVYDCQLRTYDGIVQTFIPPSLFRVTEEVTY